MERHVYLYLITQGEFAYDVDHDDTARNLERVNVLEET